MKLPILVLLSFGVLLSQSFAIDVYIVAGQSNGWRLSHLKQAESPGDAVGPKVHYFGMECVSEPGSSELQTLTKLSENTMGYGLAQSLLDQAEDDIVFVQYCRCGASVMNAAKNGWWPGEDPQKGKTFEDGLFGSFQNYIRDARRQVEEDLGETWNVKGLFWHQGESDVSHDKAEFEEDLRNVFWRFRNLLGEDLPIVAGHIRELGEGSRQINAILDRLAAEDPLLATVPLAGATYAPDRDGKPDVHIDLAGCFVVGQRMAKAMRDLRLAKAVHSVGGTIEFVPAGPVAIDLYNGNNPLKGKGGKNDAVDDAWLERLEGLTSLRKLSLSNCGVTNDGLRHVGTLTGLEELNLTLTNVSDEGLAHLARLTNLRTLGLASTNCTGAGFEHLSGLEKLESVNFHFTPLNDQGLEAIAEVGIDGRLWFAHTKFTDEGAKHLAKLEGLQICGIGSNANESSGEAVAYLTGLPMLVDLSLLDNQASPEGIAHAAKISALRRLDVAHAPKVDDASLRLVASMPNLEEIRIGGSKLVTVDGVMVLAESKSLKKLTLQRLQNVTEDVVAKLKGARPDLEVTFK